MKHKRNDLLVVEAGWWVPRIHYTILSIWGYCITLLGLP